jgi:hypothetical protein
LPGSGLVQQIASGIPLRYTPDTIFIVQTIQSKSKIKAKKMPKMPKIYWHPKFYNVNKGSRFSGGD